MCQKIISINAEADREYTLFKGSLSCSKWICQSVRKKFSCISCNVYNFPLMARGNRAPPETHIKMGVGEMRGQTASARQGKPRLLWKRSNMHPQGFCSCWVLHNYENHSQLWRTDIHPLLQGIILTKSDSKCPYSQPFNLQRWGLCSVNLTCRYYRRILKVFCRL